MSRRRRKPCSFCPQGITTSTQFYPIKKTEEGFKLGMNELLLNDPTKDLDGGAFVCHRHFKMNLRLQKNPHMKKRSEESELGLYPKRAKISDDSSSDDYSSMEVFSEEISVMPEIDLKVSKEETRVTRQLWSPIHYVNPYNMGEMMSYNRCFPEVVHHQFHHSSGLKRPIPVRVSVGWSMPLFDGQTTH